MNLCYHVRLPLLMFWPTYHEDINDLWLSIQHAREINVTSSFKSGKAKFLVILYHIYIQSYF
jgi:hypothetical protein